MNRVKQRVRGIGRDRYIDRGKQRERDIGRDRYTKRERDTDLLKMYFIFSSVGTRNCGVGSKMLSSVGPTSKDFSFDTCVP